MPDNVWILNDSAPVSEAQEFSAPQAAKNWGWFGMPAAGEGSEFEAAAQQWEYDFSDIGAFYSMDAQGGGASLTKDLADSVTASDVAVKTIVLSKADIVAIADALIKVIVSGKGDSVSVSDFIATVETNVLGLSDSVTVSDNIFKNILISKSDAVSIADNIVISRGFAIDDAVSVSDAITKQITSAPSDTISIADLMTTIETNVLGLVDSITVDDLLTAIAVYGRSLSDSVVVDDSVSHVSDFSVDLSDSVIVSDNITFGGLVLSVDDNVTVTDDISTLLIEGSLPEPEERPRVFDIDYGIYDGILVEEDEEIMLIVKAFVICQN